MSFADFMISVPPWARFLLALVVTVGITLLLVWRLHAAILRIDKSADTDGAGVDDGASKTDAVGDKEVADKEDADKEDADKEDGGPPPSYYLGGLVRGLAATAFVFLLAFTLGNFWGNASAARSATLSESADLGRAVSLASTLPPDQGGPQLVAALEAYRATVEDVEWPLMQRADAPAAYAVQARAAGDLGAAVLVAAESGADKSLVWSSLTGAVDDMLDQAIDRISQVPSPFAPGVLFMIGILAVSNLALAAMYQPARLGQNLFLMGFMAAITALLLFVVVEASNPYLGAGAVLPISAGGL